MPRRGLLVWMSGAIVRPWVRVVGVVAVVAVTACGTGGDGTSHAGEVVGAAEQGPPDSGRWVVTVKLETGTIEGTDVVQVSFDEPQLACADGEGLSPPAVPVGMRVRFVRVGEIANMMDPPVIGARSVRVDCHADTASRAVPTWDSPGPGEASDGALAVGVLYGEIVDGYVCFWLEHVEGRTAVVWPRGFSADADGPRLLDPDGDVVASPGDVVGVGGGFVHATPGCGEPFGEVFYAASVTEVSGAPVHITRR